jgi:hypothetical protein
MNVSFHVVSRYAWEAKSHFSVRWYDTMKPKVSEMTSRG